MRFSILTLSSSGLLFGAAEVESVARDVAEHNVSCISLQRCAQPGDGRLIDGRAGIREGNGAQILAERLEAVGLRYTWIWDCPGPVSGAVETAPALLSQLPVIGTATRCGPDSSNSGEAPRIVGARLGFSPQINIDVYSFEAPAASPETILSFIEESPRLFDPPPQPRPRKRGRPPRLVPPQSRVEPVRMVFAAGSVAGSVESERTRSAFSDAGFAALESIYLRPALRPTEVSPVMNGDDASGARVRGFLLSFEV